MSVEQAALERAERERDESLDVAHARGYREGVRNEQVRAEKAERALAENEQAWEDMRAYNIRLEERACEAERALAEMAETMEQIAGPTPASTRRTLDQLTDAVKWRQGMARDALARAALRLSESNDA